ncbi:hypothetical protein [Georgenia faecalis]|uniref:Uncharacterized protein n=1 Tax=Georgenia faecalis TaxID=2483799 RepID=A0ABV9D744_9MICO|nr:hypothetical protein [Georgenia faecalis]
MRVFASIGVAAVLAIAPAASAGARDAGASLETATATATVAPAITRPGGVTTNGFVSDLNCFFFKRC